MRTEDVTFAEYLRRELRAYARNVQPLPGIGPGEALDALVFQIIESVRRIRFVKEVAKRDISPERKNPASELFDPIRAAILLQRQNDFEEACWLVFLFTHFGKNRRSGYRLLRDVYGKLGGDSKWTWAAARSNVMAFRHWLDNNLDDLRSGDVHRGFGNHRKYQSLDPWKANGTGAAFESYVAWVSIEGTHARLFQRVAEHAQGDPARAFRELYKSMATVRSFGRTGRFDYLSMIGKLGLAEIRPDSVHFGSATGPVDGAKLLFFGDARADRSVVELERAADELALHLGLDKQAMEDSLCNWQKSPVTRVAFRG